jgi:shikimate dehydrogenase
MSPNVEASPWPEDVPLPPDAYVYDLVYNPPETRLVRRARAAGLGADTGLGMLIEQGALAFELWTGQSPSRALMRQAAEQELAGWGGRE